MKKILFSLTILLSFTLTQCKKDAAQSPDAVTNDAASALQTEASSPEVLALLANIKKLPNQNLKKMALSLLSAKQKYFVWADNIKTVSGNFTSTQKALVDELLLFLTPDVVGGQKDASIFEIQWMAEAQKVFTFDQIRNLVFTIYKGSDHLTVNNESLQNNQAPQYADCECNTGSTWSCDGDQACNSMTYSLCDRSSWGCGFMGLHNCNNMCSGPDVHAGQEVE